MPQIVPPREKLDVKPGDWVTTKDFRLRNRELIVSQVFDSKTIRGHIKSVGVRSVDKDTGLMGQVFVGRPNKFKKIRPPRLDRFVAAIIRNDLGKMNSRKKLLLVGTEQEEG